LGVEECLDLLFQQDIYFLVHTADLNLGLQIDQVIVFTPHPVFFFLPVLAHHDDWGLQRGNAGQNQVHQDKGIWIELVHTDKSYVASQDAHFHPPEAGLFPGYLFFDFP